MALALMGQYRQLNNGDFALQALADIMKVWNYNSYKAHTQKIA